MLSIVSSRLSGRSLGTHVVNTPAQAANVLESLILGRRLPLFKLAFWRYACASIFSAVVFRRRKVIDHR